MSLVAAADAGSSPAVAAWVNTLAANDPLRQSARRWLFVLLLVWFVAALVFVPMGIGSSWRECDTQAIARNFVSEGFDPLRPRIDWRGDTDGGVECEFPLYQAMVASVIGCFGEAEWPGRLISLLAMGFATWSLHRLLEARSGPAGALVGALVFLTGGHALLLGARVTPDALSTGFALAGLVAFLQFLGTGRTRTLVLATVMTTVACLTKPTALQIGLLQFLWTVSVAPRRLRELRIWIAWAVVLVVVAAWIVRGMQLYAETGLTFGVASGGETKFPTLRSLREKWIWIWLGVTTLEYGVSAFGFVGILLLLFRRCLDRADLALLVVVGLGLVGTLRYSHHFGVGPQYHVFAAVAGAFFAARAWPQSPPRVAWLLLLAVLAAVGAWRVRQERTFRLDCLQPSTMAAGAVVESMSVPSELAVVHGNRAAVDAFWQRRTNFEEPMLFYHARRRGWVLPRDGFAIATLDALHRRGARIVVAQFPTETSPDVLAWLEARAEAMKDLGDRRIYRLRAAS